MSTCLRPRDLRWQNTITWNHLKSILWGGGGGVIGVPKSAKPHLGKDQNPQTACKKAKNRKPHILEIAIRKPHFKMTKIRKPHAKIRNPSDL